MRTQRRATLSVTLIHIVANELGEDDDETTSTEIDGVIFAPEPLSPQSVDQAQPVYLTGVFNLPGAFVAEPGDTLVVDGVEWRVLNPCVVVGPNRTRVLATADTTPDRISLRQPGGTPTGWSEANHRTEVTPNEPFAANVPARIQAVGGTPTREPEAVDDVVTIAGYRVSVALTADGVDEVVVDGEKNTLVDVTASPDPLLVGKTLRVTDVVRGSHRFERTLLCTLTD